MLLKDSCFIFELFCRKWKKHECDKENKKEECGKENYDYILSAPWIMETIMLDLILLENQLPFFFLEKLYDAVKPINSSSAPPLPDKFLTLTISLWTLFFQEKGWDRERERENKAFHRFGQTILGPKG